MKLLTRLPAFLHNKYFVATAVFALVMLFLDKNDLFTQLDRTRELQKLRRSKAYYTSKIAAERKELEGLTNNPAVVEKYARENHLMKRDNEELFLIPEKYDPAKN